MHRVHAGYTLLAPLAAGHVDDAAAVLARLDANRALLPFDKTRTTHFATLTILPAQKWGKHELPATLLVATSFCGPTSDHVDELVNVLGAGLREVFAHCEDFVAGCSDDDLETFIREHRHDDTFYSGMQNLTPLEVRRHHELRTAIEAFIDERQAEGGLTGSAVEVRREIQEYVRSRPDLAWAQEPVEIPAETWITLHWRTLLLVTVLVGAFVTLGWYAVSAVALFLGVLLVGVRNAERQQTYVASRRPDPDVRVLAATQNRAVINEMTVCGPIKEGWARPLFLRIALWLVARLAEGIPGLRDPLHIPTVATARWIAADRGRRLVFISNYTNPAEGYVRDFIDTEAGAEHINLSFGFGRGYPKTRWITKDGAVTDPNGFMYVVTANQMPTAFWYGPYRDISIDNIVVNRQIREWLNVELDEKYAQAWLDLL